MHATLAHLGQSAFYRPASTTTPQQPQQPTPAPTPAAAPHHPSNRYFSENDGAFHWTQETNEIQCNSMRPAVFLFVLNRQIYDFLSNSVHFIEFWVEPASEAIGIMWKTWISTACYAFPYTFTRSNVVICPNPPESNEKAMEFYAFRWIPLKRRRDSSESHDRNMQFYKYFTGILLKRRRNPTESRDKQWNPT